MLATIIVILINQRKFQRFAASFFESDLAAVAKASEIVTQWNQACISSWMIRLNSPAKWEEGGKECFVEPFIEVSERCKM